MEADSSNWESKLGIKPIRTHFIAGGTYYSEYLDLKDNVARNPKGTWEIKGDSIFINQQTPEKKQSQIFINDRPGSCNIQRHD